VVNEARTATLMSAAESARSSTDAVSRGRRWQRLALVVTVALGLMVPGHVAGGDETGSGGAKQAVIARNETDGAHHSRSGVMVVSAAGDSIQPENLAHAQSSCSNCRTVAVALQAVIITGSPSLAAPKNAAVAVNAGCTSCRTAAWAYQYVVTASGPVHISPEGQLEISRIRREAAALAASGLSFPELEAHLVHLKGQLSSVVDHEVVRSGASAQGTQHEMRSVAPAA
jgi:hypothetical protein